MRPKILNEHLKKLQNVLPWKTKILLSKLFVVLKYSKCLSSSILPQHLRKKKKSHPIRKAFRLSLLGTECQFISKLNMLPSEERSLHQVNRLKQNTQKLKPHTRKFNIYYISKQDNSYFSAIYCTDLFI